MKISMMRCAALMLSLALLAFPVTGALADKADIALKSLSAKDANTINLTLGKAEMLRLDANVSDVLVANPGIVDVMAVRADQLYMVGSALGDTNIMALDEDGNVVRRLNIHVHMDVDKLSETLRDLYPEENVSVRSLNDQVVLTGHVSTPVVSNGIANLVAKYVAEIKKTQSADIDKAVVNMMSVSGEQQVMLKVKIIEVSRSALKDLGVETNLQNASAGNFLGTIGTSAALGLTAPTQLGLFGLEFATGSFGPLQFFARALEEEGILNTLAEPNLTAISGEQAGFLAGGEIPIPTQLDRNGNLVYEFRPFGVSLNFRPTVLSANRISMQMTTEVSSTTFEDNLQLNGINIPSFNVRRAQTTVELPSGGTLMIAGLLQSNSISGLTQVPGIKDVPVMGDLMKSDTFQRNESEVIVLITPYLVKPFAQNQTAQAAPQAVPSAPAVTDLKDVPRLSMSDLQDRDSAYAAIVPENTMPVPPKKPQRDLALAPSAGLSRDAAPAASVAHVPVKAERMENALGHVFEKNMARTYGSDAMNAATKGVGSFGYMTD